MTLNIHEMRKWVLFVQGMKELIPGFCVSTLALASSVVAKMQGGKVDGEEKSIRKGQDDLFCVINTN